MACHPERVLTTRVLSALVVPRLLARTRDLFSARGTFKPSRAIAIAAAAVFAPHWITIFASCFWDARAAGWAGEQVRAVAAAVAGRSDWCAFVLADVAVWPGLVQEQAGVVQLVQPNPVSVQLHKQLSISST